MLCPSCNSTNPADVQFCKHCHATLFFQCPRCGHDQAINRLCEKCGYDMDNFWRAQVATTEAIRIKERAETREHHQALRDGVYSRALTRADALPAALAVTLPVGSLLDKLSDWIVARVRRLFD
ncbi:MAG TPA: zinc ribbon domain-containing protein [Candidatus Acidoferrales bacterium]